MKSFTLFTVVITLISFLSCAKQNDSVQPIYLTEAPPALSGRWNVTWNGSFNQRQISAAGTMTLTEKDSELSGIVILRTDTFSVAGFVSKSLAVKLSGNYSGYTYFISGTSNSLKNSLESNIIVSTLGAVPQDTVGSATMMASK